MKILCKCSETFDRILPKAQVQTMNYVPSLFNYMTNQITSEEELFLVNTLSRCMALLDGDEEQLLKQQFISVDREDCNDTVREMIEQRILVPDREDELKLYMELYDILQILNGTRGKELYKIFTTTACNARCFYCFEQGFEVKTMTDETTDALFEYIMKTKHKGEIELYWFGGEPLCNPKVMTRLCGRLKEVGVQYRSRVITNGLLFTSEMIDEAVKLWNLKKCQITLDGMHEEYKRRKNYKANPENPFETVLSNIELLAKKGVLVDLRLNFDQDNIDSIAELAVYLTKRLGCFHNVFIYPSPLKDEWYDYSNPNSAEEKKRLSEVSAQIRNMVGADETRFVSGFADSIPVYYCMANNSASAVVAPDGKLYVCQYFSDEFSYGDIWQGVTNQALYNKWIYCTEPMEKCRNCFLLPQCTAFHLCPLANDTCRAKQTKALNAQIKKRYQALSKE